MASNRIEVAVTMSGIYSYERPAYAYGTETAYIYTMTAEDGTVYVWKTTKFLCEAIRLTDDAKNYSVIDAKGHKWDSSKINKGDKLIITASVKGEGEYKGQPQTILTRVKVKERTFAAETPEARAARKKAEQERKAQEQRDSLNGEDFIWQMPYKQYKEHYSDCEVIEGSYDAHEKLNERSRHYYPPTIEVIIREGRLKESGVRGEHYSGYRLQNERGEQVTYRAVKEENAIRRANKEYPGHTWECIKIYEYERYEIW